MPNSRDQRAAGEETSDGGTLRGAYLASAAIVAVTGGVLVGGLILTPGEPGCRLYGAGSWVLCPWYRRYVGNAALLFVAVAVVVVPVGLAVGFARTLVRRLRDG